MSEKLSTKKEKSDAEIAEQITRIAGKLKTRTDKLLAGKDTESPRTLQRTSVHESIGGNTWDGQHRLSSSDEGVQSFRRSEIAGYSAPKALEIRRDKISTNEDATTLSTGRRNKWSLSEAQTVVTVNGDKVEGVTDGEYGTKHELSQDRIVSEAAGTLMAVRAEVAAQEVAQKTNPDAPQNEAA